MRARSAPSITRVHTLHRVRTVVNHVTDLCDHRVPVIDDLAVADHLIETHLSRATTSKIRDQIGRRARDHLETARYLGLLYRQKAGSKFSHKPTEWGRELAKYKIHEECPSEPLEEAVLVDRICRFKLANASYHQEVGALYARFRTRPCLTILALLELCGGLDVVQVAYVLAYQSLDVSTHRAKLAKASCAIGSSEFNETYVANLTSQDRKNIRRDTLPFLDWCEQVGLLAGREGEGTVAITQRGKDVLAFYRKTHPVWWADLGHWGELAAAAILLINYLKLRKRRQLLKKLLQIDSRSGLFPGRVDAVLLEATGLTAKAVLRDDFTFDFSLSYDVPPEMWDLVRQRLDDLLASIGLRSAGAGSVIRDGEWRSITVWRRRFRQEADYASQEVSSRLNIEATVPTASIQYHFQSDYEAVTYVLLQHLQQRRFSVAKYQGQLVEYFADAPHWRQIAASNPDLLITNGFLALVECKSIREWGPTLALNKAITAELILYGQLVSALSERTEPHRRCRVVFSYEGDITATNRPDIDRFLLEQCPRVTIVLRSALQRALVDNAAKRALRGLVTCATDYDGAETRIVG